jgi:hypothetical protein
MIVGREWMSDPYFSTSVAKHEACHALEKITLRNAEESEPFGVEELGSPAHLRVDENTQTQLFAGLRNKNYGRIR